MKCCICGTVKNCGKYLDRIFANMEEIGSLFEDYSIVFYYDNSNDNTLQKIMEYQKKNAKCVYHVNTAPVSKFRTHNIAKGRNYCIQYIKTHFADYEYFIMMDCDNICSNKILPNVLSDMLIRNDWDSVSFNRPYYYDLWALSIRPYIFSCHHFNNGYVLWKDWINTIIKNTPKTELIPCASAFNGFAIYRANKFLNCVYDGRLRTDYIPIKMLNENIARAGNISYQQGKHEDCEHRHFHFQAITLNNARIRISPLYLFEN
jgi:hypothetical protein